MTADPRSVRELSEAAAAAMVALHHHDPALLRELADILEHSIELCPARTDKQTCAACGVKAATVSILRCVAALRDLVDLGLAPPVSEA